MFHTEVAEKIETHVLRLLFFFLLCTRAVYEIMWKNMVQPGRPQMII